MAKEGRLQAILEFFTSGRVSALIPELCRVTCNIN